MAMNNDKWRDFIEEYRNLPELWNTKCDKYKNKNVRHRAYSKLLKEYKKIDSNATIESLKKKIANMRTCYRRELKKMQQSERVSPDSVTTDGVYITSLWYFDLLDFLEDLETPLKGCSNDDIQDTTIEMKPTAKRHKKPNEAAAEEAETELQKRARAEHLEESKKDDAATYADGWACMLRKMSSEQQLYAKQAVDEILVLGRLDKLFLNYLHSSSPLQNAIKLSKVVCEIPTPELDDETVEH